MISVAQRVLEASVIVEGMQVSAIGPGLLVLCCAIEGDADRDIEWTAKKIGGLRIFSDQEGKMNLDVTQAGGQVLMVSQFTLAGTLEKGFRPSFIKAARPEVAEPAFDKVCQMLELQLGQPVQKGRFRTDMKVSLVNDGPVTIILDSRK